MPLRIVCSPRFGTVKLLRLAKLTKLMKLVKLITLRRYHRPGSCSLHSDKGYGPEGRT